MFEGLSGLADQLRAKCLEEAIELARNGNYLEAADNFAQSGTSPRQHSNDAQYLAYAFYRRALTYHRDMEESRAIVDLETACRFPNLQYPLRSLVQERLAAIRNKSDVRIATFDRAVARRFDMPASRVDLLSEFITRFELNQASRSPRVDEIQEVSVVGVYRWRGDTNRNEQWSQLLRKFKRGDSALPAFFGRILAEHVRANTMCSAWIGEVDYIVPVPATEVRTVDRGINIVGTTADHLSCRLGIPMREDLLKRNGNSERSRFLGRSELALQFSFNRNLAEVIRGRTVLLFDDVLNRGHTADVCAWRLKELGCSKIVLLVLAVAESSLQSSRHDYGVKS